MVTVPEGQARRSDAHVLSPRASVVSWVTVVWLSTSLRTMEGGMALECSLKLNRWKKWLPQFHCFYLYYEDISSLIGCCIWDKGRCPCTTQTVESFVSNRNIILGRDSREESIGQNGFYGPTERIGLLWPLFRLLPRSLILFTPPPKPNDAILCLQHWGLCAFALEEDSLRRRKRLDLEPKQ